MDDSERSGRGDDRQDIRVVVVGITRLGKSATSNTILGQNSFETSFGVASETKTCQKARAVRFGQKILLVDTPELFDTNVPNTQRMQEIAKCISLSLPGPHAFLLVIQIGMFTPEENDTVNKVAELFGEDVFEHMILVFTGRDVLERNHQLFEEFLQTAPPSLKDIIGKCNHRCIAVDNSADNNSRDLDACTLMVHINVLVDHGNYTNEMYRAAEREEIRRKQRLDYERICREREEENVNVLVDHGNYTNEMYRAAEREEIRRKQRLDYERICREREEENEKQKEIDAIVENQGIKWSKLIITGGLSIAVFATSRHESAITQMLQCAYLVWLVRDTIRGNT